MRQQTSGLYGAFIVLEEDDEWNPERDMVFLLSTSHDFGLLLNGKTDPDPIVMTAGTTYRLRLMNVTVQNAGVRFVLSDDRGLLRWVRAAKDGWELPPHRRVRTGADQRVSIGETFDFEFTPARAGDVRLEVVSGGGRTLIETVIRVVD